MRDNDLLLNIPTTLMANFGPHWLVMSALKTETADRLLALCTAAALPAGALKIELTESDYVVEYGAVHANMAQLQTS
ncbi:hypothetical protein E3O44_13635, partial [Cryobacterium algoricola]